MTYQHVIIVGNVGKDPDLRYTASGTLVCNFPVATNENFTNASGEREKRTTWFRVATWNKLAELCNQYVQKGGLVMVEGRLSPDPETGGPRIWKRQDGEATASYDLTAVNVRFLSRHKREEGDEYESGDEEAPF